MLGALLALALSAAPAERPVLMVLYFDNQTGDASFDVMRKGLADMLITDLVALDEVSVVEREKLEAVLAELSLQQQKSFDPATRVKLGRLVGAKYQLAGSILSLSPDVSLEARLVDLAKNEVKVTARVKGAPTRLFDLEQELVKKLSDGMQVRLGAGVGAKTKVGSVASLLDYSTGIDAADRGDAKAASSSLAKAVSASPGFTLAKDSWARVMERLARAESRRATLLGENETRLAELIEKALAPGLPVKPLDDRRGKYIAYRSLKGAMHLGRIKALVGPAAQTPSVTIVPPSKRAAVLEELRAWFANTKLLLQELKRTGPVSCSEPLAPADAELARSLGLGATPTLFCLQDARVDAAEFVIHGRSLQYDLLRRLRPSFAELDPAAGAEALKWYAEALNEPLPTKMNRAGDFAFLLGELQGDALLRLGEAEAALGMWQDTLDRFPANARFTEVQDKIRVTLGASPANKEIDKAAAGCDVAFNTSFAKLQYRWAETAPMELVAKASVFAKACKATRTDALTPMLIQGTFQNAGVMLLAAGACDAYRATADAAASYDPAGRKYFETQGAACYLQ